MAMGTHGVAAVRALAAAHAEAGQVLVAAPVLGRPDMAASGQLGIVAGGPAEAVERCRPLFEVIGRRTFEAGPLAGVGDGDQAREQLRARLRDRGIGRGVLARPRVRRRATGALRGLVEGLFSAPAYKVYGEIMVAEELRPGRVHLRAGAEGRQTGAGAAGEARMPLPSANLYRDRLLGAIAHGDGERDGPCSPASKRGRAGWH